MAKRIGPEAKIIALFTALPEDSRRIVHDLIKGQMAVPRKASTKKASKKVDTEGTTGTITTGTWPVEGIKIS